MPLDWIPTRVNTRGRIAWDPHPRGLIVLTCLAEAGRDRVEKTLPGHILAILKGSVCW
jgi:hypothetical protein